MAKKGERDYLYRKAGESTWYVRLVVPKDVRAVLGNRRTLTKTTGTSDKSKALMLRLPILSKWKAAIEAVRQTKVVSADVWQEKASIIGKELATSRNVGVQAVFSDEVPESLPDVQDVQKNMESFYTLPPHLLARMSAVLQKHTKGLQDGIGETDGLSLANEQAVLLADIKAHWLTERYALSDDEQHHAAGLIKSPSTFKPRSPITKGMLERWQAHLHTQIPTKKTIDTLVARVGKFSDYLSKEGASLSFDTVHAFLGTLPLAKVTRTNYLWACRKFWDWACRYEPDFRTQFKDSPNPFNGHELPKVGAAKAQQRTAFTVSEIERLYTNALTTRGEKEQGFSLSHLIVFGAYTGMRLEEIGNLKAENTIYGDDGEPVGFSITESKTKAGIRELPIHTSLLPLYKHLLAHSGKHGGYLFAGGNNKYGKRLDGLSKRFGRLKTKLGFGSEHVFHSVRHTVATELHRAGVSLEVLPFVMGHESANFTLSTYSQGASFQQKQEAVQHLTFSFDLTLSNVTHHNQE